MEKSKTFSNTRFPAEILRKLVQAYKETAQLFEADWKANCLKVEHSDSEWSYDDLEEFFADYRVHSGKSLLDLRGDQLDLHVQINPRDTYVSFSGPNRSAIESVFSVLEAVALEYRLEPDESIKTPDESKKTPDAPVVFIGHGRSSAWRDLKEHLQDQHDIKVEAYEAGARAGHTIRDILEEMIHTSTFALLVLTAEDEQVSGDIRARQNVIHETGLFQGALGFSRAIMLVENGVENFSNIDGIQQIRFSSGNIRETFGDVLATLKREFPS